MKRLFILIVFFSLMSVLNAQNNSECMNVAYQYNADGLKIRWVFNDYINWRKAVKNGISIRRAEFDQNFNMVNNQLLFESLKPATLDEMKTQFSPDNMHAAVAAQMLYGKSKVNESEDFGSFIKNKVTEQEVIHSTAMYVASLNFEVAASIALGMQDAVESNRNYVYKMYIRNSNCDTIYLSVNTHEYTVPAIVADQLEALSGEKSVHLSWDATQSDLVGYYIEKSPINKEDFVRLNLEPLVLIENEFNKKDLIFVDTLQSNYDPYQYRLVGINAFGDETSPAEAVVSMGRDATPPPAPVITKIIAKPNEYLSITWNSAQSINDFQNFNILRSKSIEGPYKKLNSAPLLKEPLFFNDTNPEPVLPNFYIVEIVDTAGNKASSLPVQGNVIDTIAPACPKAMFTDSISNGNYTLIWDQPGEQDILGFRVYFANAMDHAFTLISNIITDTVYEGKISLNTLTEKAYFKVTALDFHYNESGNCNIIGLYRNDTVKPVNAVFKDVKIHQNKVHISWIPSDSSDGDSVYISRKSDMDTTWKNVFAGLNRNDSIFLDSTLSRNTGYTYAIFVMDKNKNRSDYSVPYHIVINEILPLMVITEFRMFTVDGQKSLIWNSKLSENQSFVVYASSDGGITSSVIGRVYENKYAIEQRFSSDEISFSVCIIDDQGQRGAMSTWIKKY